MKYFSLNQLEIHGIKGSNSVINQYLKDCQKTLSDEIKNEKEMCEISGMLETLRNFN